MNDHFNKFADTAKDLSKNPLGIIALFILLVYGFACILLGITRSSLDAAERAPLIWFLALFPVAVLIAFCWLVANHHKKLYAPKDFENEDNFLLDRPSEATSLQDSAPADSELVKELLKTGEGLEIVLANEEKIKKDLDDRGLSYTSDSEAILIRHLAVAQSNYWFERCYSFIFGSQLQLLKHLNENRSPVNIDFIEDYFVAVKNRNPEIMPNWTAHNYINFLLDSNLLAEKDGCYQISIAGNEFLTLLARTGYSMNKPN